MEWVLDWNLNYRTAEDVARLFAESPFDADLEIQQEPSGIIMFAEATRATSPSRRHCVRPGATRRRQAYDESVLRPVGGSPAVLLPTP